MKLWLSICAALFFAAGCAFGLLLSSQRACERAVPSPASPAAIASDGAAGESVVASMVEPYPDYPLYLVSGDDFYDELGLDKEQRRRLDDLFARHFESVREVRRGMADVAAVLREGVLDVLTPDQEVRFNEVQKRYSETKIRYYVGSELAELREVLALRPEQEPGVFKHLYDAHVARQAAYRQKNCKDDRSVLNEQLAGVDRKLETSLKRELFADQFADYLKLQERKRCGVKKKDDRAAGKDGKDCTPAAKP